MRIRTQWGLLGVALLLLAGCGGSSSTVPLSGDVLGDLPSDTPATGGTLSVVVTDDPFPIDYVLEASVMITRIEAHDQESDGWTTLSSDSFDINLVGLTNGLTKGIVDMAVDPGTYDQFRFITGPGRVVLSADAAVTSDVELSKDLEIETPDGTSDSTIVVTDGYVFTAENGRVKFPSGPQTGIKVHVDPPIVVSSTLSGELELAFDLGKNFVFNGPVTHAPGVKRVLFTPSVKASNTTTQGSVEVMVLADGSALRGAEAWLVDADGAKAGHGFTDELGVALIKAGPGTYTLKADKWGYVEATLLGDDGLPVEVEVVLGNLTPAGTLTLLPSELTVEGMVYSDHGTPGDLTDDDELVVDGVAVTLATVVTDAVTGEPIYSAETVTVDGSFSFERLEEQDFIVSCSKDGYVDFTSEAWAPTDGAMSVVLTALSQALVVTVSDGADSVVTGAAVSATDGFMTWTVTDGAADDADGAADGQVTLTLPTGSYTVTATSTVTATDGTSTTTTYVDATGPKGIEGDTDEDTSDAVTLTPGS